MNEIALHSKPHISFFDNENKKRIPFCTKLGLKLLLDVVQLLERENIIYHLEGGTLLGIVRDQQLLPWDDDLDISIPQDQLPALKKTLKPLKKRGWDIEVRRYSRFNSVNVRGVRLVRIRDRSRGLFRQGTNYMDIFVKQNHDDYIYWQAKGKLLRVHQKYYDGYEHFNFNDYTLKVPCFYEQYLEEKFGNWRKPVKNWNCASDEKTIVE